MLTASSMETMLFTKASTVVLLLFKVSRMPRLGSSPMLKDVSVGLMIKAGFLRRYLQRKARM